jgi:hypothetical protein
LERESVKRIKVKMNRLKKKKKKKKKKQISYLSLHIG